eukprot:TRINITY_DN11623_c0_g1_i1.p1 TRINITY_DN11623_c0_g1~~TRINITY_DN11623_c0_g1_i1.p1  ORF type:complete len:670 (-),score=160.75 TRINITY_DN11623_c0_g1_i1:105-1817(-)
MKTWPFTVTQGEGDKPIINVTYMGEQRQFSPEEISSMVLGKMKDTADNFLGQDTKDAVVTVPAYFNDAQRIATKQAGEIAGLNIIRIINEPTAAAIAYGLKNDSEKETTILVFDYGGGTLDVSVLTLDGGIFEVRSTGGDTHLGGEDLDQLLVDYFIAEMRRKNNMDITGNDRAMRRLRTAVERAKRALSGTVQAAIELDSIHEGTDFYSSISRARFEELCADEFRKCLKIVIKVLGDAGLKKKDIDEVVLVGGSTRIPKMVQMLEGFFEGKKVNKSINPDEAVAYGAAVQAGILRGNVKGSKAEGMLLLDVIPLNLGIATQGGVMAPIVTRNSTIPCSHSKMFTNARDNQEFVDVKIYEGERVNVRDNNLLGKFQVNGIPRMPKRKAQIEVKFDVDADGILSVSATEKTSGTSNQITISDDKNKLTPEQIEKMLKEAEEFAVRDKELAEINDWLNSLESYSYAIKETLQKEEVANNLEGDESKVLSDLASDLIMWLEAHPRTAVSLEDVKEKRKQAESVYNAIMSKVYSKQGHTVSEEYAKEQKEQQEQQQQQQQQGPEGGQPQEEGPQ